MQKDLRAARLGGEHDARPRAAEWAGRAGRHHGLSARHQAMQTAHSRGLRHTYPLPLLPADRLAEFRVENINYNS